MISEVNEYLLDWGQVGSAFVLLLVWGVAIGAGWLSHLVTNRMPTLDEKLSEDEVKARNRWYKWSLGVFFVVCLVLGGVGLGLRVFTN